MFISIWTEWRDRGVGFVCVLWYFVLVSLNPFWIYDRDRKTPVCTCFFGRGRRVCPFRLPSFLEPRRTLPFCSFYVYHNLFIVKMINSSFLRKEWSPFQWRCPVLIRRGSATTITLPLPTHYPSITPTTMIISDVNLFFGHSSIGFDIMEKSFDPLHLPSKSYLKVSILFT